MEFHVLGPLEVLEGGRKLPVGSGRQRAVLLALLLHRGEAVSSERLIDELWGEQPPPTAAKVLQGYVSQLRRVLPQGAIQTLGTGYALLAGVTDAAKFERLLDEAREQRPREAARTLRSALALWRGPALADVEYEEWARGEIARLEELKLVGLENLFAAELELGSHSRVVPALEALVREHPLRERLRAQLMLALYQSGRQADALAVFADARQALVEQLGLEPSPELRETQRRILAQDPELAPARSVVDVARPARWLLLAAGALLIAAAAAAFLLVGRGRGRVLVAVPNSLAVIDPAADMLVRVIAVGQTPTSVAVAPHAVWVLNSDEETVSLVDPAQRVVVKTIGSGPQPVALTVGAAAVWVAGSDHVLRRIDPATYLAATARIPHASGSPPGGTGGPSWVAGDSTSVWASNGVTLSRVEPPPHVVIRASSVDCCGPVVLGAGSVWTTDAGALLRLDAHSGARQARIGLPFLAGGDGVALAVGAGSVWIADGTSSAVWRIDVRTNHVVGTITVGNHPSGVAVGAGAVWVASSDGTVSRIDPNGAQGAGKVVRTIEVGGTPNGIAAADGAVWVSVD